MSYEHDQHTNCIIERNEITIADALVMETVSICTTDDLSLVDDSTPSVFGVEAWASSQATRC